MPKLKKAAVGCAAILGLLLVAVATAISQDKDKDDKTDSPTSLLDRIQKLEQRLAESVKTIADLKMQNQGDRIQRLEQGLTDSNKSIGSLVNQGDQIQRLVQGLVQGLTESNKSIGSLVNQVSRKPTPEQFRDKFFLFTQQLQTNRLVVENARGELFQITNPAGVLLLDSEFVHCFSTANKPAFIRISSIVAIRQP